MRWSSVCGAAFKRRHRKSMYEFYAMRRIWKNQRSVSREVRIICLLPTVTPRPVGGENHVSAAHRHSTSSGKLHLLSCPAVPSSTFISFVTKMSLLLVQYTHCNKPFYLFYFSLWPQWCISHVRCFVWNKDWLIDLRWMKSPSVYLTCPKMTPLLRVRWRVDRIVITSQCLCLIHTCRHHNVAPLNACLE